MLPPAGVTHTYTVRTIVTSDGWREETTGILALRMLVNPSGNGYAVWTSSNVRGTDAIGYGEYYSDGGYAMVQIQEDDCISVDLKSIRVNCTEWIPVYSFAYKIRCITDE
ncbi:unnamed protein product, partial [Rotaria sordida]